MPAKYESKYIHVRLKGKAAKGIRRLVKETRRPLNEEANIAVERHISIEESRRTGK